MNDDLSAENLRLPEQVLTGQPRTQRRNKEKAHVPDWFSSQLATYWPRMPEAAVRAFCQLAGKGIVVGLVCYQQSVVRRSLEFKLPVRFLRSLGTKRGATYRALAEMKAKGLLDYRSRQGGYPIVTLIPQDGAGLANSSLAPEVAVKEFDLGS